MNFPLTLPPLSLYIHVPWCIKKCPYCDFNSHQSPNKLPEADYISALLADLKDDLKYTQQRKLRSIFIGGGTPSLFSAAAYATLLNEINQLIPFNDDIEITLEANPGTFEQNKFTGFKNAGINRLSIGIQSFQKSFLSTLGRVHDDSEALTAVNIAQTAGFDNINLDLMFGLPEQSVEHALEDLSIACSFQPNHISWYQLTIEQNTHYYRYPPTLPHEDLLNDIQLEGKAFLTANDFQQYETSAYAKPDKQSKHNLNYWRFGDYLGIGAGAHGKLTLEKEQHIIRTRKTRQPNHYLDHNKSFLTEAKKVPVDELPLEYMMNALRLCHGTNVTTFEQRTGLSITTIHKQIQAARDRGLLTPQGLVPSALGQQYLNDLLGHFL